MRTTRIVQPNLFQVAEVLRSPIGLIQTSFEEAPTPDGKPQAYWCWSEERGHHAFTLDELAPL